MRMSLLIGSIFIPHFRACLCGFVPPPPPSGYYCAQKSGQSSSAVENKWDSLMLQPRVSARRGMKRRRANVVPKMTSLSSLSLSEQELAFWIATFSTLHIGMSAVRETLIQLCGELAQKANLIDRKMITLPSWWPGDNVGKNQIFPDTYTAGRQIYRLVYTIVSFLTLGGAISTYLSISHDTRSIINNEWLVTPGHAGGFLTDNEYAIYYAVASASFAASIASLFNASPLSLMPGFQQKKEGQTTTAVAAATNENAVLVGGIQRNDEIKFEPKGLTRITRHPLILPVVPWGVATAFLTGTDTSDWILFGGLSVYAMAGCACQDLRIRNKEGSVGTVFLVSQEEDEKLDTFFSRTSFLPFAAVIDGRQPIRLVLSEFPLLPFVIGLPVGGFIENALLGWLG